MNIRSRCFLRIALALVSCLIAPSLPAQISGRITDPAGEPLAFVSVLPNDESGSVAISDIEGRFTIDPKIRVRSLLFRYVGFEPLRLEGEALRLPAGKILEVVLQPVDYAVPEVVIRAGENPADILIRRAIAHRHRNNPERYTSFICNTYNKVMLDALPNRAEFERLATKRDTAEIARQEAKKSFDRVERAVKDHHFLFMETVTERSFKAPNQNQERVLFNRVSGFRDMALVAVANAFQPFTFYGDYLRILDKDFVNPISPGSPKLYAFRMEDTLFSGADTVWVISFRPRKGKVFDALEGVLHLHSRGWAVQNVRAQPAKANGLLQMKIEQAYQLVETHWFPRQLNFEIELPKYPDPYTGMRISGRSFIDSVRIGVAIPPAVFIPEMPVYLEPAATSRPDSAWQRWRDLAPLSRKELRTYAWLDSISTAKHFGRVSRIFNYVVTGKAYLGAGISLDLNQLLRFNQFENTRLSLALTTAEARPMRLPRRLEFAANGGYGFGDQAFKYGASGLWRITRYRQTQLRLAWQHDLSEPGALYELPKSDFVNRSIYARRMDYMDEWSAGLGSDLWPGARLQASFRRQIIRPGYDYRFGGADFEQSGRFDYSEFSVFFRYAADVRARRFLGSNVDRLNKIPILELAYTRGLRDLWAGDYHYDRWAMALYQSVFIRRLGRMSWRLEAGWVGQDVPAAKLFTLNQSARNSWALFVVRNTFQSLPDTLFLADRFVNVYWAQELGPVLYHSKRSAPVLTLLQNLAWGDLRRPELHQALGFRTAYRPLLESGIQLDHLLLFKYLNMAHLGLGGALFYRWGGLDSGDWKDNFVPRLSLKFSFG